MEYTLEHQVPNFAECWWDHVCSFNVYWETGANCKNSAYTVNVESAHLFVASFYNDFLQDMNPKQG